MKCASVTILTCLLLAVAMGGCEPMVLNEGDPTNSDVSGMWSYVETSGARSTWTLTQASDASVAGSGAAGEVISGYVSGDFVSMAVSYTTNSTSGVKGTVTGDTIAGTFTNSASAYGAWTAYRTGR